LADVGPADSLVQPGDDPRQVWFQLLRPVVADAGKQQQGRCGVGAVQAARLGGRNGAVGKAMHDQRRETDPGDGVDRGDIVEAMADGPLDIPQHPRGDRPVRHMTKAQPAAHQFARMGEGADGDDGADAAGAPRSRQQNRRPADGMTDQHRIAIAARRQEVDRGQRILGEARHRGKGIGLAQAVAAGIDKQQVVAGIEEGPGERQPRGRIRPPAVNEDDGRGAPADFQPPAEQRLAVGGRNAQRFGGQPQPRRARRVLAVTDAKDKADQRRRDHGDDGDTRGREGEDGPHGRPAYTNEPMKVTSPARWYHNPDSKVFLPLIIIRSPLSGAPCDRSSPKSHVSLLLEKPMTLTQKLGAEFLGTFWLVFGGCGSAVLAAGFPGLGIGFVGVALAFGLTVLTMAYAVGHISGGHFNPAVTIGLWAGGRFPASEILPYWIAQVAAAIAAAAALYVIASGNAEFALSAGFAANGFGEHSPGGYTLTAALAAEILLTFFFLVIIMGATDKRAPAGFAPIAIGLGLTLIHLISIPVTNTSVNPARSTGQAIFVGDWAMAQLWLFWLAPLIGGALGGLVYRCLGGKAQSES
jgi:aquaporin Z